MQFAYTIVYVSNVTRTIEFYEKAFGFKRKFISPEKDYGEIDSGATTLSFASLTLAKSNFKKGILIANPAEKPLGIELAFTTKNIESDFKKALDAGAIEYEPIKTKPWGQKVGYLRDLDGVLIEFCTPMG